MRPRDLPPPVRLRWLPAALLVAAFGATATAQHAATPYFDRPDAVRHAFATYLMDARLGALDAHAGDLPDELAEQAEALVADDLPRIAGSLASFDPELHDELTRRLEEVAERAERGSDGLPEAIAEAREAVERARGTLLSPALRGDPAFNASVMALLLVSEASVGEAYEEAVGGERWEFPFGWAALKEVRALWQGVRPVAGPALAANAEEALASLEALFPSAAVPAVLAGDPEEAEAPSHYLVATLESITDVGLYPDRELGRLAGHAGAQAERACAAVRDGRDALAMERLLGVVDAYAYLGGTASFLAPEAFAAVGEVLEPFAEKEDDEEDREEGAEDAPSEAVDLSTLDCDALIDGLDAIRAALGG